ncbi:MAG: SprB repeat-containing protein [Bacteroidales bacterium]|nr:SprB repeat-containing protein [Bacteroidales bacterium]
MVLRKILALLAAVLVTLTAAAQLDSSFIIDFSDMAGAGDGYIYAVKKFNKGELRLGDLDNKNWDLSSYKPDTYDTVRFYNKNRSRYGNLFPNSELVRFQTKKNMEFRTMDSSKVRMQGIINDYLGLKAAVVLVFPTDLVVYKFPIMKGRVTSDSISKKFVSSYGLQQFADSVRIDLDMSNVSVFDTVLTIKTPIDTYTAIREKNVVSKRIVAYKNSHLMGWRPAPEFGSRTKSVYYRWFAKKGGIAVVEVEADALGNVLFVRYQYRQPMEVTLEKEDVKCKGDHTGSINVVVNGGTPDYTYKWSNGKKGKKLDSLAAGTYTVTVTDCKGNTDTKSITIDEPDARLDMHIDYNDIHCYGANDANLRAVISGGTTPYYIVWSDDTEAPELTNRGSGVYGCIVRDANRCFVWDSVEVLSPQIPLTMSPKVDHSICYDQPRGAITFDVNGGDEPYKFWMDDQPVERVVENVRAGIYTMKVADKWGCELVRKAEVKQPSSRIEVEANVHHVKCSGSTTGSIELEVSGGTPGYKFEWSNGEDSKAISGLKPGNYYVTITDANNCCTKQTYTVTAPASILKFTADVTDISCKGGSNGAIKIEAMGGIPPYSLTINNKNKPFVNENLKAGSYNVQVTDNNGCSVIETVLESEPEEGITIDISAKNSPCKGRNMGALTAEITNGKPPYKYSWNDGNTSLVRENISAGHYTLSVSDSDGCTMDGQAIVNEPDKALEMTLETTDAAAPESGDATYNIRAYGGVPPYEYQITDRDEIWEKPKAYGIKPGKHTATVIDNVGCKVTKEFEIKVKKRK